MTHEARLFAPRFGIPGQNGPADGPIEQFAPAARKSHHAHACLTPPPTPPLGPSPTTRRGNPAGLDPAAGRSSSKMRLSAPAVARSLPSCENAEERTAPRCPSSRATFLAPFTPQKTPSRSRPLLTSHD